MRKIWVVVFEWIILFLWVNFVGIYMGLLAVLSHGICFQIIKYVFGLASFPLFFENGCETRTFMPKFGEINERRNQLHEVIRLSGMNLIIDDTDHPLIIKVASIQAARMQVYFIDSDDYFRRRKSVADENGVEYEDNDERCVFFARGVLETVKKLRWTPDIIHCQGWMCSVIPLYIKQAYQDEPAFANTKIVTSLFSEELHGSLGANFRPSIVFRDVKEEVLDKYGNDFGFTELEKLAIDYSDGIVNAGKTVNPELIKYAEEKGLPVISNPEDDAICQTYMDFYDKVLEGKSE